MEKRASGDNRGRTLTVALTNPLKRRGVPISQHNLEWRGNAQGRTGYKMKNCPSVGSGGRLVAKKSANV